MSYRGFQGYTEKPQLVSEYADCGRVRGRSRGRGCGRGCGRGRD